MSQKPQKKKGEKKTVLNQNHLKILADFDIKQETFSDNLHRDDLFMI